MRSRKCASLILERCRRKKNEEFAEELSAVAKETAPPAPFSQREIVLSFLGIPVLTGLSNVRTPWFPQAIADLMILWQVTATDSLRHRIAFVNGKGLETLVTANFRHGGWPHFLGNLVFFLFFGNAVEQVLSRKVTLLMVAGLRPLTLFAESLFKPPQTVLLGGNGVVVFLVATSAMLDLRAKLKILVWSSSFFALDVPLWVVVAGYVLYNLLMLALRVPCSCHHSVTEMASGL